MFNSFDRDLTVIGRFANDNFQKSELEAKNIRLLYDKVIQVRDMLAKVEYKIMDENIARISKLPSIQGCYRKTINFVESRCDMLSLNVKKKMINRINSLKASPIFSQTLENC